MPRTVTDYRSGGRELFPLPEALRRRAVGANGKPAFTFVSDRGDETRATYADLDLRARAIAAEIQARVARGARAVLLFPPGLEFLHAFMGCQYAGVVCVPVQPPRRWEQSDRLKGILEDSGAELVLTTSGLRERAEASSSPAPGGVAAVWIDVEEIPDSRSRDWREREVDRDDVCLLQYTSGSTSRPKGVVIRHRHLLSNAGAIRELAEFEPETDVGVSWLPPHHDMGLMGNMLQQVLEGYPQVLLSPLAFLKRPLSWLRLVTEYRATISCAPNFGFDLCARKATPEAIGDLDLSSLRLVVVGAEPVRAETLERFTRTFAPCGFDPAVLSPCYGLAEATLIVTGRRGVSAVEFDRQALSEGRATRAAPGVPGKRLVSCGPPIGGATVRVVDPETRVPQPAGRIGEIWVDAGHVASGYYGHPERTAEAFEAVLAETDGSTGRRYLRTGDAGAIVNGELFVSGRYKEVIVIAGATHFPHDIEGTVAKVHPALRSDRVVAFPVENERGEALVVGVDLRPVGTEERDAVASSIRQAVLSEHGLAIHALVALRPGDLQKTSSGKPQRYLARESFERGELGEVL